jgi:hypothetical protein
MASPKQQSLAPAEVEQNMSDRPWNWTSQSVAPVNTLLHVRTTGQAEHNEVALKMLNDLQSGGLGFQRVVFAYYEPDAPLSWHLTTKQQASIDASWCNQMNQLQEVKEAFRYPRQEHLVATSCQ